MNALAQELNALLAGTSAGRLLSETGQRMYFPKGILSQSAEANERAKRFNATIGMAYHDGQPMILDAIQAQIPHLSPKEAVAYASTPGVQALRETWRLSMSRKNPSLNTNRMSLPVVVPGLTAAISYLADLFVNPGDPVVVADMFWPNYRLIMEERMGAKLASYAFFTESGGYNVAGMESALREAAKGRGKATVIFNFPNNPTGYTPTVSEAKAIREALNRAADSGIDILAICDDAYFGFQYEPDNLRESLFSLLFDAHERILAAKADGPTKEDYVWGFRGGFVTFANPALDVHRYEALVKKLSGVIRSSISNSTAPTQYILLKAMADPSYEKQKAQFEAILERRYKAVKAYLAGHRAPDSLKVLPFNSGYFMCFECRGVSAEQLRLTLLDQGIGTISIQDKWLRVAFSAVEEGQVPELFDAIYAAAAAANAGRP